MPKVTERPGDSSPAEKAITYSTRTTRIRRAARKEGEEQMRLALEREAERKKKEEKERMEMLAQLQGGIAPTELNRGEGGYRVQFNAEATKADRSDQG